MLRCAGCADLDGTTKAIGPFGVVLAVLLLSGACAHHRSRPLGSFDPTGPRAAVAQAGMARDGAAAARVDGPVPAVEAPFESPPPPPPLSSAALAELQAEIDAALDAAPVAASSHSVLIVQADTGQVIYQRSPDRLLKPASNIKLFTTAAALRRLGEGHRPTMAAYAEGTPSPAGRLAGDLVLRGEHELALSRYFYDGPRFVLDRLAAQLVAAGVRAIEGQVVARGEFVYDGQPLATLDVPAHRAAVAAAFRDALQDAGIAVQATATSARLEPPSGWLELAGWRTKPLSVLCSPINRSSHNELADGLLRHLGYRRSQTSSYAAGAAELSEMLRAIGLDTTGVEFRDGSGLSHRNRLAARHIIGLLLAMRRTAVGPIWQRTLAVAGVRGTIRKRLDGPDTRGRVYAKTGTLHDVIALSGLLHHRHDGQPYAFSLLMNDVADPVAARAAHDQVVAALAAERRGLGSPPAVPTLTSMRNDRNGTTITVRWAPVAGAEGYLLWRSPDGQVWQRPAARYLRSTSHRTVVLESSSTLYVRLSACNQAGESDGSDVYAARASPTASSLLIVDGNDRWQAEPQRDNPLGAGHDFVAIHSRAVGSIAFDSCADEALHSGEVELGRYQAVLWAAGEESTEHHSLSAAQQALLTAFSRAGGAVLLSGAEIGWDLVEHGSDADQQFYAHTLRAGYLGDDAGTFLVRGAAGLFSGLPVTGFYSPDGLVASSPDRLAPALGSTTVLSYVGAEGAAAVQVDGPAKLVYLGFPFESIDHPADRAAVMGRVLGFFEMGARGGMAPAPGGPAGSR